MLSPSDIVTSDGGEVTNTIIIIIDEIIKKNFLPYGLVLLTLRFLLTGGEPDM